MLIKKMVLSLVFGGVLLLTGCEYGGPDPEEEPTSGTPLDQNEEPLLNGNTCWSQPPAPITRDGTIGHCNWKMNRNANYVSAWVTAARGSGSNPVTVEIAWIAVYGRMASDGSTRRLYYTQPGDHGLDRNGQWAQRNNVTWFFNARPAPNLLMPGDTARVTWNNNEIVHMWNAGNHIQLCQGMADFWVEAQVRSTGDARIHIGMDYFSNFQGGESWAGEAAVSDFVSGNTCNNDWVILSTPSRRASPNDCTPRVNFANAAPASTIDGCGAAPPAQPPPNPVTQPPAPPTAAPPPPPPPPAGNWTFQFTPTLTPVSALTVFRKGSAWQQMPVTPQNGNTFQVVVAANQFVVTDTLVIAWTSNGQSHWGCEQAGAQSNLRVNLTATGPDGRVYTGRTAPYGTGCDVGLQ